MIIVNLCDNTIVMCQNYHFKTNMSTILSQSPEFGKLTHNYNMVNFLARMLIYVNMSIAEVSCHLIPCIYLIPCILILIPCIRFNWFFKFELKTRDLFLNAQNPNKNTKK